MRPAKIVEVTQDVETRVLPEVMEDLTRAREKILAARRRLPRKYPELATGELSRPAVLHGDLSILVSTLDEALAQAQTAVSGVLQE
jgi:hypothetical protein